MRGVRAALFRSRLSRNDRPCLRYRRYTLDVVAALAPEHHVNAPVTGSRRTMPTSGRCARRYGCCARSDTSSRLCKGLRPFCHDRLKRDLVIGWTCFSSPDTHGSLVIIIMPVGFLPNTTVSWARINQGASAAIGWRGVGSGARMLAINSPSMVILDEMGWLGFLGERLRGKDAVLTVASSHTPPFRVDIC